MISDSIVIFIIRTWLCGTIPVHEVLLGKCILVISDVSDILFQVILIIIYISKLIICIDVLGWHVQRFFIRGVSLGFLSLHCELPQETVSSFFNKVLPVICGYIFCICMLEKIW